MNIYKIILTILITSIFSFANINKLETFNINKLNFNLNFSKNNQQNNIRNFKRKYFLPWNKSKLDYKLKEVQWVNMYSKRKTFNKKLLENTKYFWKKEIKNSNWGNYNTINKKAIVIKEDYLRLFPNKNSIYSKNKNKIDINFDYNINTSIKKNMPLLISHYSKDKKWAYVLSNMASGWIEIKNIAFISNKNINKFKKSKLFVITQDNSKILYKKNKNIYKKEYLKMSTIIPNINNKNYIFIKNKNKFADFKEIEFFNNLEELGLDFNKKNILKISNTLINEKYGWGGKDNKRDCSLLTRDFFIPFGVLLDRNSKAQINKGKKFNLKKITNKEKFIIKNGKPFQTILYMPGHIMLYVGHINNRPLILHNFWSIFNNHNGNLKKEIIGKSVITTLNPFNIKENKYTLLNKITYMNNIIN